ncbi:MAG: phosphoribosylformylglycinamidine synthase subunit PurL [candidate division KSB1 bacterium]|nr:phosphoribosylformylglycinamidine synthase subunit PurL [candidate division KSB1 bacterium]
MVHRVEIGIREGFVDPHAVGVEHDIRELGITGVRGVLFYQVYYLLSADLEASGVRRIAEELLADPVTQEYRLGSPFPPPEGDHWSVEIAYRPGVMDPVEESARKAIRDLGIEGVQSVKTARRYVLLGHLTQEEQDLIVDKVLANKIIERRLGPQDRIFYDRIEYQFRLIEVPLLQATDEELIRLSRDGQLFLNLTEMRAIQDYFRRLGRNPTDVELETLAQTWSEHCSHKTLKGKIEFNGQVIDNLLRTTVMRVTEELAKPWCLSVFKDNSGVIEFDDEYAVCFKVETHNHPSALEPYGGANTGIGGVIRDPLGTGLGAKPIANTDVFAFGPPDYPREKLPPGVLHPKRIMRGVVAGVRDYGNRMGIPTVNGAILFDERYIGNPLVYAGNVGIMPKDKVHKQVVSGDLIVLIGGRTGRDGIHGATFSSGALTTESEEISSGAVQIGNPITEKKVVDTLLQARDRGLYRAITDCGAGGLSSAVGELAASTGAEVHLERVPLKYEGLSYTEIWISEAQERMVLFVPPEKLDEALALFASEDVEATVIGRVTSDRRLRLYYQGHRVADLDMDFLHHGLPQIVRKAEWRPVRHPEPDFPDPQDLTPHLHRLLSSWNIASKEWVIRQYDHEVQGGSVLKPLVGRHDDGPSDAAILRPRLDSYRGIILANGINPKYGDIDPYWMAASAIDEAVRQVIAVGGSRERLALLDNFCWGDPDKPDRLGSLVRAAQACYDVAKAYGTPFISGKDSLNNEFAVDGDSIAIPGTLLISALAVMPDVRKAVSMDLKEPGNLLYVVGVTRPELGGSHYWSLWGYVGNSVPKVDLELAPRIFDALSAATAQGLVRACHDCSEGGLGVALAEMAFAGGLGAAVDLRKVPTEGDVHRNDWILFAESNTRFVVEIRPDARDRFERLLRGIPYACIGWVTSEGTLRITGLHGRPVVEENVDALKESWQRPFRW